MENRTEISVSAGAFFSLAVAILILPLEWVVAWVFAATVHELSHFVALRLCNVPVYELRISAVGACMAVGELFGWKALLCAIAGPVGGLLLLPFLQWIPRTALCGLFQSVFNLIPVYPLDGGRILQALLISLLPGQHLQRRNVENMIIILILVCILLVSIKFRLGIWGFLLFGVLLLRRKQEKHLANFAPKGYNGVSLNE